MSRKTTPRRPGIAIVYGICRMTALLAIASLGLDFGMVQLTKAELQRAADAAARAAAIAYAAYHQAETTSTSPPKSSPPPPTSPPRTT